MPAQNISSQSSAIDFSPLRVMVLAGGPDRERPVSLVSGDQVAAGLRQLGHETKQRDIRPNDLSALDEFIAWRGEVLFLAMHGSWGEGGGLQRILESRGLPFFGCNSAAAAIGMDKAASKQRWLAANLPTPRYEILTPGQTPKITPPLVIKPLCEGSSIDVVICKDAAGVEPALKELFTRHDRLMIEQFVAGLELTVGIIGGRAENGRIGPDQALPPVQIVPVSEFYDYQAKYLSSDTQYIFDMPLPAEVLSRVREMALAAHQAIGARHLSRVDFIVDNAHQPWLLEINTIPGFTSHSLVPKAAAHAGISWLNLVDRLVRLPMAAGT